jgi:hypothetical protein
LSFLAILSVRVHGTCSCPGALPEQEGKLRGDIFGGITVGDKCGMEIADEKWYGHLPGED